MNINKTCRELAKKYNIDPTVVHDIVTYEFEYTRKVMQDPTETKDILFNKLFKFKLKTRYKTDKTREYGL